MTKDLYPWMIQAIDVARRSSPDVPVGALVVKEGKIIAEAHNQREEKNDPAGHAEIVALRIASRHLSHWRMEDCILVSTLEPCPMCAEAIIQTRVKKLVFGAYDSKSGACGSAFNLFVPGRIYRLPEVIGGIKEEECSELLKEFFRSRRNDENKHV